MPQFPCLYYTVSSVHETTRTPKKVKAETAITRFQTMITSIWEFLTSWFTPTSLFLFLNLMIGTIVVISRFGAAHRIPQHLHQQQQDQFGHYHSPNPLARAPSLLERVKSIDFSFYKSNPPAPETEYLQPTDPDYETRYYPNQLVRQPSLLDRLKSINFSRYKFEQIPNPETEHLQSTEPEFETLKPSPLASQPSLLPLDRFKALKFPSFYPHEQANYQEMEMESNPYADPSQSNGHLVQRRKSDSLSGDLKKSQPEKIKKSVSEKAKAGNLEEDDEIVVPATTRVDRKSIDRNRGRHTVSFREDEGVDAKADDFISRFKNQLRLQRLDSLKRFGEMLKGN